MIYFHTENIKFTLQNKLKIKSWIKEVTLAESKKCGAINYIFVSDEALLKLNIESLNHDFYTDIITFDFCENNIIHGDLYISIDRVRENAVTHKTTFIDELHRVMIHGILHLCGYGDKTSKEEQIMRKKEENSLNLRDF